MSGVAAPAGYEAFGIRGARVVAMSGIASGVRDAMAGGTLFQWASRRDDARALAGRGTAWATTLPGGVEVVVRHSRHGGTLAPITDDLFLAPTRAPQELRTALRLQRSGVRTSDVLAYAVYPAFGPFRRADVVTRLMRGADLPAAWRTAGTEDARADIMRALASLLVSMRDAGVVHPDLNLKNIFIVTEGRGVAAFLLDVDRVAFHAPASREAVTRNLARLHRSAAKWNREQGLGMDAEAYLAPRARRIRQESGS
ncbi:MAG TPA: lipopolysaccharide kinase InaA family protein [Gemmatimonadaceae bacterium]|nr:lipopolysaccharide kinase InaA family protein [Gemmatimonadaceae bacterium]